MARSSRMFEVIQFLRGASKPTPAWAIADALEVTKRTIYRDIAALQAMRVPIEGEAGVGYVMRAGFDLPPLMFTPDEIEAIAVGLSLIGRTRDTGLQKAASCVTRKISDVLPNAAGARIDGSPLRVSHWNSIPPSDVDVQAMRKAIRDEEKLFLHYHDAEMRSTERTVCPIALIYYVDNIVLAAWCEVRADFRHFRVDRVRQCLITDGRFKGEGDRLRAGWKLACPLNISN